MRGGAEVTWALDLPQWTERSLHTVSQTIKNRKEIHSVTRLPKNSLEVAPPNHMENSLTGSAVKIPRSCCETTPTGECV